MGHAGISVRAKSFRFINTIMNFSEVLKIKSPCGAPPFSKRLCNGANLQRSLGPPIGRLGVRQVQLGIALLPDESHDGIVSSAFRALSDLDPRQNCIHFTIQKCDHYQNVFHITLPTHKPTPERPTVTLQHRQLQELNCTGTGSSLQSTPPHHCRLLSFRSFTRGASAAAEQNDE